MPPRSHPSTPQFAAPRPPCASTRTVNPSSPTQECLRVATAPSQPSPQGKDAWHHHERVSYVWIKKRWVAYPFQNNIAALDEADRAACLKGLVDAKIDSAGAPPTTFDDWILRTLGKGIADLFMRPYNFKVWGYPTTEMQCKWLGEVSRLSVCRCHAKPCT